MSAALAEVIPLAGPAPVVICPYCGKAAHYIASSAAIYRGVEYGPLYICRPCQAWVGVHRDTLIPLGRLADRELRLAKMEAHHIFDAIWRNRYAVKRARDPQYSLGMARGGRYKALAQAMGIPRSQCHIGMFDAVQCRVAIEICRAGLIE